MKIRIYKMLIRAIIQYGAEAWTLSEDICDCLRASKRKILRRICGAVYSKGQWRVRYSCELQTFYEDVAIVTLIRVTRMNWMCHVSLMDDTKKVEQVFNSQPGGVRTRGRPRSRWWECVWTDIKEGRIMNRRKASRNRIKWKKAIEEAKVHLGLSGPLRRRK
jgi:hypothetical protein